MKENDRLPRFGVSRASAGDDREGETRSQGVSTLAFKVTGQGSTGRFVVENVFPAKGGPARHLHHMPPQDPALWRAHGMELLGPPLRVK